MTKKDYIIIANAFNLAIDDLCESDLLNPVEELPADEAMHKALTIVVASLSNAMEQDNPRFNSDKFAEAIKLQNLL